jgi:Arc/MetJ family transcription regulator
MPKKHQIVQLFPGHYTSENRSTKAVGDPDWECVYLAMEVHIMRTNIVIDDKLMRDTLRATGLKTKREVVEEGLRTLLRLKRQAEIRKIRGKLNWQGDLDAMRRDS